MITRLLLVSALFFGSAGYVSYKTHPEQSAMRAPLASLPLQLGQWEGREGAPFASNIVKVLGVDEYINRVYLSRGTPYVSLYVGFYQSQRQGDTMHSPLNCLPGAGWQPVRQDRSTLSVTDASSAPRAIRVNQFVIQKGLDRQMVLYWYQSHGRVVASEYTSKIYLVYDAMRLNRTDGAMVRVTTPIEGTGAADDNAAAARLTQFVQRLFPHLSGLLPS
jgi:EpsI family protein